MKVRKVGNSHVLTVPSSIPFLPNADYGVFAGEQGAIVFYPKSKNPFKDREFLQTHSGLRCTTDA
ncbi:type II toxin-antitoxin system PemI/MazE family antitoxin [Schleiferilactobacillus perolens]|uniref:type II toxin-antitoxin system PemI/MazE family antitoxin n=1 Tax=Schleiferilactobacillus perolens TaxID=100468 RepID=UPI00070EEE2D|nr:hypothetical protein [Schleiferilactobacillus perolens]MCI1890925.1 antitoxin of toxin-antitoxin stability system [Schleiferilactobacillus harbinensis]MCI1911530.1 antitoxin of toxin-antitoxin stability system [Schleiferilactobacillus harbinensis]MCI2171122.1 antitoxin of toxin-antitoxin stability system [Schleiferilactobacillus perolens]